MKMLALVLSWMAFCMTPGTWADANSEDSQQSLTVTATAYNSTAEQTDRNPHLGAWGDRLDDLPPGLRAVAVSPDLVAKGLERKRRLRIDGFKGEFVVLDRTSRRHRNRVDIYMGKDVAGAKRFGKKKVKIHWAPSSAR